MGKLVDGKWLNDEQLLAVEQQQYKAANGRFQRGTAAFRNWITVDGSAGISGEAGFKAQAGRYHLFAALDNLEQRLSSNKYLLGDQISEADWRLLPTLVRFDVGYYSAFKCNLRAIRDYPHLSAYLQNLYAQPGVASTVDLDIYRAGYHSKSPMRNPHGIVPVGFTSTFN